MHCGSGIAEAPTAQPCRPPGRTQAYILRTQAGGKLHVHRFPPSGVSLSVTQSTRSRSTRPGSPEQGVPGTIHHHMRRKHQYFHSFVISPLLNSYFSTIAITSLQRVKPVHLCLCCEGVRTSVQTCSVLEGASPPGLWTSLL